MAFPVHSQLVSSSASYYLPFRTYPCVFASSPTIHFNVNQRLPTTTSSTTSVKTVSFSTNAAPTSTCNTLGDATVFNRFRSEKISTTSFRCFSALTPELRTTLDKVVTSQKIVLFMKGTKDFPQCGFSNSVVQILASLNVPFETINILENEILRQGLKEYSNWPTFPQLYIDGEFFGGCDITVD